jgi:signal transduction histidine kinase
MGVARVEGLDAASFLAVSSRRALVNGFTLLAGYLIVLAVLAPWARASGPEFPQLVTVFTTGIVVADLATSFLLVNQCRGTPYRGLLLIGCAYLFSALFGTAHLLTFPGALLPDRAALGSFQLTAYVFNLWRLGFALLVSFGLRDLLDDRQPVVLTSRRSLIIIPALVAIVAVTALIVGVADEKSLPALIVGSQFTSVDLALGWIAFAAGVIACAMAWAGASRDLFHLWLALALSTFCGDLFLSNFSGGRFTLGWYVTRASSFVSAYTLFLFFLLRFAAQQRFALRSAKFLRKRTLRLQLEISRRSEAEERLSQLQKLEAMGQLTGGIAHDFNNLLAAIVGNLDLLKRNASGDKSRAARWIENALSAAERGKNLTAQLLVFARVQRLELAPVNAIEAIDRASDLLRRTLGPEINVRFDVPGAEIWVMANPTQLELTILNLALNARDAMPKGGDLRISIAPWQTQDDPELPAGAYIRLSVADNGAGMPPEVVNRAFDPFFTTKGAGKGTGLGLSQVFGFARKAGGTARIESRVGAGTIVHIFLRRADATLPSPQDETDTAFSELSATVLVIDDDPDVRQLLVNFLTEIGLRVVQSADGSSGLSLISQIQPDLLIVDFAMPGMNGAEVARKARALIPGLPIMFVTGYADSDLIDTAMGEEAIVLKKPFRLSELQAVMSEALRRDPTVA